MNDIRYVVTSANETSYNEIDFFEYVTEARALAKVNEIMLATNDDTTTWEKGQEREFLALCAEHPHTWGAVAMYDLTDLTDAEQAVLARY